MGTNAVGLRSTKISSIVGNLCSGRHGTLRGTITGYKTKTRFARCTSLEGVGQEEFLASGCLAKLLW